MSIAKRSNNAKLKGIVYITILFDLLIISETTL